MLRSAARVAVPAGSVTHWEGEGQPHLELVVAGVVRVFVTAEDGRTMTVRYCRTGGLLGAMSLFGTEFEMPASTQTLVDTEMLRFDPDLMHELVDRELAVAHALLNELAERARQFLHESGRLFATVRQRTARHLLDLASESARSSQPGRAPRPSLVVRVSQQELADAVGTVREVIVRVLRDLRNEGVVRTRREGILIIEPVALIEALGWNSSPRQDLPRSEDSGP